MHPANPLTWFHWIGEFIRGWFLGLPWSDAPKAIPAIILSIVLFTIGFIAFSGGSGWRNRLLEQQYRVSVEREDFSMAEIVVKRQLEADPDNVDLVHKYAMIREAQSFTEETEGLMKRLLERRHVPAAKWLLVNRLIGTKLSNLDEDGLDEAELVFRLIMESSPGNQQVKKYLVDLMVYRQQYALAIPLLEELSAHDPLFGLNAAELSRQLGNMDAAERYATTSLSAVEEMLQEDPTSVILAMRVAKNQVFLKRHSEAIRTLRRSIELAKSDSDRRVLTQGLGDAIVAYVNYIEVSPTDTIQQRLRVLRMLQVAVQIAPNNPRVIRMVADHVLNSLDEDDKELVSVREALVTGSPTGIAHFIKGTSALMKEDHSTASLHLELAIEQMPRSGAILNNLAVALAMKEEPEYEKALEVSNAAIEMVPTPTPHFYETRGQILFRMGRFREAISDIEKSLEEPTLALKGHKMLADCYEQVGDLDLAKGHREAFERGSQKSDVDAALQTGDAELDAKGIDEKVESDEAAKD